MSPKRIQMSRQHPWRADNPDAIVVTRPGPWGNPYTLDELRAVYPDADAPELRRMAVSDFRGLVEGRWNSPDDPEYPSVAVIRAALAGHDLACWCPLDQACHADVLLEVANPAPVPDLFDGAFPDPETEPVPAGLGKDAQRTLRQRKQIESGIHPATRLQLIEHDPTIEPVAPTCGTCAYLWQKSARSWSGWKCTAAAGATHDGPDMRKHWPACVLYTPKEEA